MKVKQLKYLTKNTNDNLMGDIGDFNTSFAIVFGSLSFFSNSDSKLYSDLLDLSSKVPLLGCSTAGEIFEDGVFDETLIINLVNLEGDSKAVVNILDIENATEAEIGAKLSGSFDREGLKLLFTLGKGVNFNGSEFINGLKSKVNEDTVITGGLAGDAGQFTKTFVIANGKVLDNGVGALGLYGNSVGVGFGSRGGWSPFGPLRKVTKSEGNVLFELDGEPALKIYKEYLGEKAEELPGSGLLYPLSVLDEEKEETGVIRTILGIDEDQNSLTLAGDIHNDSYVKLMQAQSSSLIDGASKAAGESISEADDGLAVLISCVGRKLVLEDEVDEEVEMVAENLKNGFVTGYYSNGEICPHNQNILDCKLHNQTMTITYIYEK